MIDWHETLHQKELLIKQFIDRKVKWKKSENIILEKRSYCILIVNVSGIVKTGILVEGIKNRRY